ncbi:hypothetical protein ACFP2T_27095 [Plantactinospora solaniradicis]|uniref:DUF1461 domain-containing protein n=1 Tax=Plantactinospora solaniradicis TaxID=1723736 RepID=A0ABW1KFJ0_9ACTN
MSRRLATPYRLLLRVYPKGSRRGELADTLLMAAEAGHVRPGPIETLNLLRQGMRARLGRPLSRGVVVLAIFASIFSGFLSASLANRIGWEAAPALPTGAAWTQLAEMLTPGLSAQWYERSDDPFRNNGGETDAASVSYSTDRTPATEDVDAYLAGLQQRLEAAGWTVTDTYSTSPTDIETGARQNNSQALIARNDALVLRFEDYFDAAYAEGGLRVSIYRAEPRWLTGSTLAVGLLGMLAGWLLAGWASRRLEHRPLAAFLAATTAIGGLVLLIPAWLLGSLQYLGTLSDTAVPDSPFWHGLVPTDDFGGMAYPAGAAITAAIAVAVLCPPRPAPATDPGSASYLTHEANLDQDQK